ncbi:MAG: adenylate/guanylate cyclase domain-containing protein [Acidimicrobiia bacterium]
MSQGALTFLFTDIEGSTRRWADGEKMSDMLAHHDRIARDVTTSYGGQVVKHTGDGIFAVFDKAADAVEAAVAMQRGITEVAYEAEPILVRMGLHTGTAIAREDDLFGLDVSTCARIMGAAHGGQILASDTVRSLVGRHDTVEFVSLGSHRLKDLADPRVLFQVSAPGLDDGFPPLRTLEAVPHNLPVQLTSFVGREADVATVADLVQSHRLVTLTGVGGTGKTRLSLQVAAELTDRFPDGVWFVELAPVADPDGVPIALASVLGVRHERGQADAVRDRLLDRLRPWRSLLVIDNCEHLLGAVAGLASEILSTAPEVRVLASSREGLGIRGEHIWQVPSLEVGEDADSAAVRLFLDRAQAVAPQLDWNDQVGGHIVRICRLLDGIPLAIELAAARARVLSPEQIAARLDDRFRLLTGGSRAALPRQQTLEATVDWSYRLLTEQERRLFERLSVFVGGFTLEAAEAVGAGDGIAADDVLDLVTGLVDRSMILADQGPSGVSRYRMLETLRAFGFQRLADADAAAAWKDRHLSYFSDWLGSVDLFGWDLFESASLVGVERGNIGAAFEWAQQQDSSHQAPLAAALALDRYLNQGDPEEALAVIRTAAGATSGNELRLRTMHGRLLYALARVDEFLAVASDIEQAAESAGQADAVWALAEIGLIYAYAPELEAERGIELTERAVERSVGLPDQNRFRAFHSLAFASLWGGRPDQMTEAVERAVEIGRRLKPVAVINALSTLLLVAMTIDQRDGTDLTSAVEDELFDVWEASGRVGTPEYVLWAAIRRGWWDLADTELARLLPSQHGAMRRWVLMPLAVLRLMRGELDAADRLFDEFARLGPVGRWHHDYFPSRAELAAWRGDLTSVGRWVDEHRSVRVDESEDILRLAGLRAKVRAQVDADDRAAAEGTLDEMRRIHAGGNTMPAVQLGSPDFYLVSAEAELTRLTGPDPAAWGRAEELAAWIYWKLYCRVRRLEAGRVHGEAVGDEATELRSRLTEVGANGLIELLDTTVA